MNAEEEGGGTIEELVTIPPPSFRSFSSGELIDILPPGWDHLIILLKIIEIYGHVVEIDR